MGRFSRRAVSVIFEFVPAPEPVTRVTLFVPGKATLRGAGFGEWLENPHDGSYGQAFSFGTVEQGLMKQIEGAPGALLVPLPHDLREGRAEIVKTVEGLRQRGALAVRIEQSKLGWEVDEFLEVVGSGSPAALHRLAVTMLVTEGEVTSCGMHAFSLPDSRVARDGNEGSAAEQALLTALNVYQLGEDPLLLSGHTFSPDANSPRRALQRWPDDGYPPAHWCHNPFGVWRIGPPGGKGRPPTELHAEFMPSLVVLLSALEAKKGTLTREQVEEATRAGVCIALDHRKAKLLERTRGYADIDPELAWEQWCVVRENRSQTGE